MTKKLALLVVLALILATSAEARIVPEWVKARYWNLQQEFGRLNSQGNNLDWTKSAMRNSIDAAYWSAFNKIKYGQNQWIKNQGWSEMDSVYQRVIQFYRGHLFQTVDVRRRQADVGRAIDFLLREWPELRCMPIWEQDPRKMQNSFASYREGFRYYYQCRFTEIYGRFMQVN